MIPVCEPWIGEEEIDSVVGALRRGEISGSFGSALPDFERRFAELSECKHAIAVTSGTTALHLAIAALGIQRGDEILVSASTNIATALAAYHHGAVAVPVDSEDETWNLDLELIDGMVTPRTRAIIPVHLFGHPVDMDRLLTIADANNLVIVEDCAEAHGATCRGRSVGSFGLMGCYSFYANKLITTGEGGAIVTNDDKMADRLRSLRNLAFTTPRFRHEEAGYNYRMTGYQAAMGLAQLDRFERILKEKRRVARTYSAALADVPGLRLPVELPWAKNVYWMYALEVLPWFGITRDELQRKLRESAGIDTRTFFCPMSQQPFLQRQKGARSAPTPVADRIWKTGLYLPSSCQLDDEQIQYIADQIRSFLR